MNHELLRGAARSLLGWIGLVCLALPGGAEGFAPSVNLLWTGSWALDGSLINRGDLRLKALGCSLRTQFVDKRPGLFWETLDQFWDKGFTAYSAGFYHAPTGSRLLYGILEEWGLAARLRNPWGRSPVFAEAHKGQGADLRTGPSAKGENEWYLYLGSPWIGPLRGYISAQARASRLEEGGGDESLARFAPAVSGGLNARLDPKTELRLEGFSTGKPLAPYQPAAWFSAKPPLPEREFRLYGASAFFTAPFLSLAADGAYSETFAWGRGWYGNLALSLGANKPWRLSLGADAGNKGYTDREGNNPGAGFRGAAGFTWKGVQSSLFRTTAVLRASGLGEPFNRISGGAYYHFPGNSGFPGPVRIRPVKLSLAAGRNAQDPARRIDSLEGDFGLGIGVVQLNFHAALKGIAEGSLGEGGGENQVFSPAGSYRFDSLKLSGELSWRPGPFQFRTKLGYTGSASQEAAWDASVYASIRGKPGQFSLKVSSPKLPASWTWGVSWRLQLGRR